MIFTIRNTTSREFVRMLDHMIGKTNKSISFLVVHVFNVYIMKRKSQQHFINRYSLEIQAYSTSIKCVLHIIVKMTWADINRG